MTAERDAISSGIRSGVTWKAASQIILQVSRMVVALILARLLAPGAQCSGLATTGSSVLACPASPCEGSNDSRK